MNNEISDELLAAAERWKQHKSRKDDASSPYYSGTFNQNDSKNILLATDMRKLSDWAVDHISEPQVVINLTE